MTEEFKCEFCGKVYQQEKYFINHFCEKKRRWNNRDTKHVKMGFITWQRFMKINKMRGAIDYEKFMSTNYYIAFVKFGKHILNIQAIDPERFADFVLKNGVKLDDWCKDYVYDLYLHEWYRKQPPDKSMEQTVLLMQQWAREHEEVWTDFFEKVSSNIAVHYIMSGRLSPWMLYHSEKAKDLFVRMDDEQMAKVEKNLNPTFWKSKFAIQKDDVKFVKRVIKQAGL